MKKISKKLNNWYNLNARDLIWRKTKDPYCIWLSEIIMQQTRVEQGTPYYERFVKKYPTVLKLAQANEEEVLKLWQGLGYYSRGRNLLKCAQIIVNEHNGKFPNNASDLKKLPGIGDYTSAAISSIAFEEPIPCIDGNVIRVTARVLGINDIFPSKNAKDKLLEFLTPLLNIGKPSITNQALMELGSTLCKPTNPHCITCPFNDICLAYKNNTWQQIPNKKKKKKALEMHMHFLHIHNGEKTLLIKRDQKSIWANLFEFPNFIGEEFDLNHSLNSILTLPNPTHILNKTSFKHLLSHRTIYATFWEISLKNIQLKKKSDIFEVPIKELGNYPIHRLMDKYLTQND